MTFHFKYSYLKIFQQYPCCKVYVFSSSVLDISPGTNLLVVFEILFRNNLKTVKQIGVSTQKKYRFWVLPLLQFASLG